MVIFVAHLHFRFLLNLRFEDCSKLNAGAGGSWLSSGENQNLRRWSRQGERNEAPFSLGGSVSGKDDLISVGPDGKGGRIKVLRSKPQFSVSSCFFISKT